MKTFWKIMLSIAIVILATFVQGVVLKYCWNWFITPLGFKEITILWALGIASTISIFTYGSRAALAKEDTSEDDY